MSAHWTCSTPFQHKELERSDIFDDNKWDALYGEAVEYLRTSRTQFDDSIRQQLVKDKLGLALAELFPGKDREILSLPLACKRSEANPDFVEWTATDTILGESVKDPKFRLLSSHQCTKVLQDPDTGKIIAATVKGLMDKTRIYVFAKKYVICGGSVLTPQILFNSGFRPVEGSIPALVSQFFCIYDFDWDCELTNCCEGPLSDGANDDVLSSYSQERVCRRSCQLKRSSLEAQGGRA